MKPKDTPNQYVIYSRKSKFTGKGESIENQIELCRQYIAMHFGEDASENVLVYEDEGFSGGNLERPQFKKMMKDSRKIAFAAIVVYRLDRISRNIGDFAERAEFDGEHGIMVYNRSLQRPGKANQIRPMEEWIVAVGKHPGIVAGSDWVRVQAMLDVNKSKSYRRPRSNVALLTGLLRCGECGDYMRPKLTNRKNAEGELIYTYMCSTKERSHGTVCSMKNCNGNTLDAKIIEEIRKLSADKETLTRLLAQTKKVISGSKGATTQSWRCSVKSTPRRKSAASGWWSPCPLPATPPRSTSWSRSTRSIRRARHSSCALPSWKPSPNRAGCCIRSSPSIRK